MASVGQQRLEAKKSRKGSRPRRVGRKAVRRQGRPAGDQGIGRQKLIMVTRELLRSIPPSKLTADRVARAAGGDRALVRYYFGTLQHLLAEVAVELSTGLVAHLAEASAGPDSASVRLRQRIREFVRYELENPALHPLYAEHILSSKSTSARETVRKIAAQGHASFCKILEDGRRRGEFRRDFDLRLLDIAIVGLSEFIVVGRPILEAWLSDNENIADLLEIYGDFIADLVINGISA